MDDRGHNLFSTALPKLTACLFPIGPFAELYKPRCVPYQNQVYSSIHFAHLPSKPSSQTSQFLQRASHTYIMSSYGTTTAVATPVTLTHVNKHTSSWAKVRRVLLCSSANSFEGDNATDKELEALLQKPIRRGGVFMGIEVEWAEEKPKRRSQK